MNKLSAENTRVVTTSQPARRHRKIPAGAYGAVHFTEIRKKGSREKIRESRRRFQTPKQLKQL